MPSYGYKEKHWSHGTKFTLHYIPAVKYPSQRGSSTFYRIGTQAHWEIRVNGSYYFSAPTKKRCLSLIKEAGLKLLERWID